MNEVFTIDYTVKLSDGSKKRQTIRVKNKSSKFIAKCSLEEYLKRKHKSFRSLTIHSCVSNLDLINKLSEGLKQMLNEL
jgi:hypothetical protein